MTKHAPAFFRVLVVLSIQWLVCITESRALEIDWSGQFWSEFNFVHNYATDNAAALPGGYNVPSGGYQDASFQSLFLRLRPKLVVNDNIYIKSEWWVGDPIFGIFGNAVPYPEDQRQYYSSQSRGALLTAQRFWGEFVTDMGTFQVGRVPLHWGLGVVWNSGENLWDRYMSTGDAIRWIAKFGAFSFIPSIIVNSVGNSVAGSCTVTGGTCTPGAGVGGVTDYSLVFKYENPEEELEGGLNVIKRLGGANQDQGAGFLTPQGSTSEPAGAMNLITYDFYARKKFNRFSLSAEAPIVTGTMGASNVQSFGFATETTWKASEITDLLLKAGYASGQANLGGSAIDTYRAFYFNPNYHIGMILFNYKLSNFSTPQTLNNPTLSPSTLGSPYDNPIVDAMYLSLGGSIKPWDKWTFRPAVVYARAPQGADASPFFFKNWNRQVYANTSGKSQSLDLGWEADLGVTFQWDEYFQFSLDSGIFFPGGFYAFSNSPTDNSTPAVFASSVRLGVNF